MAGSQPDNSISLRFIVSLFMLKEHATNSAQNNGFDFHICSACRNQTALQVDYLHGLVNEL